MSEDIEKQLLDFKDDIKADMKINPDYYIHSALLMAQRTLMLSVFKTSISEGILGYSVLIEHIEMLCRAAGYITEEYPKKILEFQNSPEFQKIQGSDIKMSKMANKKLELLMTEVFGRTPITSALKG